MGARRTVVLAVLALAVGAGAVVSSQSPDWKAHPGVNFPLVGGNWANQRYSTLTKINKSNVKQLGGAWMLSVENGRGGWMQSTPVVVDGVMYLTHGHISARNAKTGQLIWQFPKGDIGRGGGPAGGPDNHFNRGVVVAEGKVFAAGTGSTLMALDQKTGDLVWRTPLRPEPGNPSFANAPATYHDGLVYIGLGGGEQGVRGQFGAYDAKTGKEVWRFFTVPGPGEFGHDTWEGESWKTGGAPVWTQPAIDPELGLLFVPTGNPWPVTDGTKRGGDNLFSVSIVALDLKTGVRKWHYQTVHHDLWDYDSPAPPVLADVTYQGRPRKILMHGGKTGMMYILDRTDGKPLIGIEERPVPQQAEQKTAKTQPYPIGDTFVSTCPEGIPDGYPKGCVFTPFYQERVAIAPGTNGGLAWAPMSYSPQTGSIYVCASIRANGFTVGGFSGFPFRQKFGGTLTAMNPTTNKIVWQKEFPFQCGSGSGILSTASGLLFRGQSDGLLVAHDAANGDVLWSFQTGAGADAPVATYEVDGEQYVAILAGGNAYMATQFGDNLWAFKLGGTVPPATAPRAPGPPPLPPIVQVSPQTLGLYAASYALTQPTGNIVPVVVALENGRLTLQYGAAQKAPMYASSDTDFFTVLQVGPTQGSAQFRIRFVKDASGAVTEAILQQGQGPEMRAARR